MVAHAGKGNAQVLFCPRNGYIESAGIFPQAFAIAALDVEKIGIGTLSDVEYDDAIELKTFGFMGCGNKKPFVKGSVLAVA